MRTKIVLAIGTLLFGLAFIAAPLIWRMNDASFGLIVLFGIFLLPASAAFFVTSSLMKLKAKAQKLPAPENLAGFGERAIAFFVDIMIFSVIMNVILFFLPMEKDFVFALAFLLLWATYYTVQVLFFGNTVGKTLLRLKIVSATTQPLNAFRIFLRAVCLLTIDFLFLGVGYWIILIDKNKQGVHDGIASTYVVKART